MEKLLFVFRRKAGTTRAAFHDHYVGHHSPLGLRLQRGLSGYTVNHLVSDAEFDTVTEIWTSSARDFAGGGGAPDGDGKAIVADHISFMGPQDTYVVREEVLRDGPLAPPLATPAAGRKLVAIYAEGEPLPLVPAEAHRAVDNRVVGTIYLRDRRQAADAATGGAAVIRTTWFAAGTPPIDPDGRAVEVREYRYRTPEQAG